MHATDLAVFHWLNAFAGHTPALDAVMIALAKYAPIVVAAVLLFCWARWRPAWQRAAALAGVTALLSLAAGQLIGMTLPARAPIS